VRRAAAAALFLAGCGSSSGSTTPPPPAPADARIAHDAAAPAPSYKAALRQGWDLAHAGDHAAAVVAFQAALAQRPDDPRALTELSWEALQADDLALAIRSADRAIAVATDPRLQAQAYYNLGRAAEARSDAVVAIDDYQRSLALRPNRTVAQRLAALTGRAPAVAEPARFAGPFADLAAFCAELGLPASDVGDPTLADDVWCSPTPVAVPGATTLPPGVDRVAVVRHADTTAEVTLDLAFQTAKGWWVLADFGTEDAWPRTGIEIAASHGAALDIVSTSGGKRFTTRCTHGSHGPTCAVPEEISR
jgi:tetratricopeptide (TPR) repeat protein